MVNGAIHSFVKTAQLEMVNGIPLNVVSSGLVVEALKNYEDYFLGHNAVPMGKLVNGYVKSVAGKVSGTVIRIYE